MKLNLYNLMLLLAKHGFVYVDGKIQGMATADNTAYFDFSTGYNGHGDSVWIEISDTNKCVVQFDFRYTFDKNDKALFRKEVKASKLYNLIRDTFTEYGIHSKV